MRLYGREVEPLLYIHQITIIRHGKSVHGKYTIGEYLNSRCRQVTGVSFEVNTIYFAEFLARPRILRRGAGSIVPLLLLSLLSSDLERLDEGWSSESSEDLFNELPEDSERLASDKGSSREKGEESGGLNR